MSSDYLLDLGDVKGESKDDVHKEAIEIASWSLGASNPTSVGSSGMSAGKVSFSDLSVMISLEKASVELLTRVCTGKVIPKATLYGRKAGDDKRQDYLVVEFEEVMVSSWQTSASDGGGIPMLSVSLAFSKITYNYFVQGADQKLETSPLISTYDLKALKK
jgi:type VI secretion system secreted protein Hcp